ncbi:MAG: potassium transporter TrkH [Robiginitomaculum sp.]|nr:MAG: potassium transporter TrkH [Robiginitomaculum sp.]
MPDLRPVLFIVGLMIAGLGVAMLIPMLVDLAHKGESWQAFGISGFITALFGSVIALASYSPKARMSARGAFLLTVTSWVILAFVGALPFILQENSMSFTDAYFESMSGLTTTGSTVMTGLDQAPRGILLWRAMLQWYGGIGIIITAIAILPRLNIGGMQLFRAEWFDPMGKILPRAGQIATGIGVAYIGLTVICAVSYNMLGIEMFDAICLAMTTIATGGFTNSDASFAAYTEHGADMVAVLFMILASLPFAAYVLAMRGNLSAVYKNPQTRGFLLILLVLIMLMTTYMTMNNYSSEAHPLRLAMFNITSIITGTGYSFGDYQSWGPLAVGVFFSAMFIGGCAGSTSCSIKIFRYQVAFEALRAYVVRMPRRHAVSPMRYGGRPLPKSAVYSVMGFFFIFMMCYAVTAILLSLMGLDEITALSAAATSITNVGPGLGDIVGPTGTFQPLPNAAKWVMAMAMIVGRLEIIPVLVVLNPSFWRA